MRHFNSAVVPVIRDRRGTVFVLFSLLVPVALMGFLGLLGLFSMSTGRADLQAASDAAANAIVADLNSALTLSATPDALVTDIDKQARADAVVNSLLSSRNDVSGIRTQVTTTPQTISVAVSAQFRNVAGDLFSLPLFASSAVTTVNWLRADQLQIALAIDAGTTNGKTSILAQRLDVLKPALLATIDALAVMPNYPDIALAVVPFTAQIATDPAMAVADASGDHDQFIAAMTSRFASAGDELGNWFMPKAHAGVIACYNQPIIPANPKGADFGGTNRPVSKACASSLPAIRPMQKISRPYVKGQPKATEPVNAPAKIARDDIKSAINAIAPAGCRNLAMGTTWALAQLPVDTNPKIIVIIANGNNSQNAFGRTNDCAGNGSSAMSQAELDAGFVASCNLVRDETQNKGRRLDLFVLQAVDGNAAALKSCASTTDNVANYFNVAQSSLLPNALAQLNSRVFQVAQKQKSDPKSAAKASGENDDE